MSEAQTPGQIAYEAYAAALPERVYFPAVPWLRIDAGHQHAWDAAALAVLAWEDVRQKHQEGRHA